MQDQLFGLDGRGQLGDEQQRRGVEAVVLGPVARHPEVLAFGRVHGQVGALEQDLDADPVLGRHGNTDAGLDRQRQTPSISTGEPRIAAQPRQLGDGVVRGVATGQDDPELVAAETSQHVARPQLGPQPGGERHEQAVAVAVAEGVVDLLEAVEIDDGDRHRVLRIARPRPPSPRAR